MNVIITSGGTSEYIDSVRKITNSSSGKLGSIIANRLLESKKINEVFYVCHKGAFLPNENEKLHIIYIKTVENLQKMLKNLIKNQKIDAIIHSMAVSDYKVEYVTTSEMLSKKLSNKSQEAIKNSLAFDDIGIENKNKLSSNFGDLFVKLVQTPKVISKIKQWDKNVFLIGFKLLSNVTEKQLIEVAKYLMETNNCDVVVANDRAQISGDKHIAHIIAKDGKIIKVKTKYEIADKICDILGTIQSIYKK